MKKNLTLTLCYQCKEIFKASGHRVYRTKNKTKEPCAICRRFGWEYKIKSGGERGK